MAFQSMNRGLWKTGGGAAACAGVVTAATASFTSYLGDRAVIRSVDKVQSRLYHHLVSQQPRPSIFGRQPIYQPINKKYFSSSATQQPAPLKAAEDVAAKKITEAAKPASADTTSKKSFVEWYEGHLDSHPVLTKMVTGCLLWSIGDATAQVIPYVASDNTKPFVYDLPRTGRAALFGFAVHAPTSHLHFNFLEYLTQRVGVTGYAIPVFKTIMEQVRIL
jgi:hypothetical protein